MLLHPLHLIRKKRFRRVSTHLQNIQFDTYQQQVIDSIKSTDKNICVSATAGAGKTTVILECLRHIPKFKKSIFLSFSNGIVGELKQRVPIGVEASTLHSLGYRMLQRVTKKRADEVQLIKRVLK